MQSLEVLIPVTFFALLALIVYFVTKYQYQTRKAIIDKGGEIKFPKRILFILEIGGLILGVGLGLAVSVLFQESNLSEDSKDMLIGASIMFFGGLGLIVSNLFHRKLEKQDQQ